MLIRCPKCNTGFNLPGDKIPAKGAKMKCSACTHTFRVRMRDGKAEIFYKKGEGPVKAPSDASPPPASIDDSSGGNATSIGLPASKSAREGYDPFPLAGMSGEVQVVSGEETVAASTSEATVAVSSSDPEEVDFEEPEFSAPGSEVELDLDDIIVDEEGGSTQFAPGSRASADGSGERTQFGAPMSEAVENVPGKLTTTEEEGGKTQMGRVGAGGSIDLFDGEDIAPREEAAPVDFDPFGDAFDEPVGDVGLLMPSTPQTADFDSLEFESSVGEAAASEEDFLLGGGRRGVHDAMSLVDSSFGDEMPSFDPRAGRTEVKRATKPGRRTKSKPRSLNAKGNIEIDEQALTRGRTPSGAAARPARQREPERVTQEAPREPAKKPLPRPAYAEPLGASSGLRRGMDTLFITLIVIVALLGFMAARNGGFIDFARFGHTIEVAFAGAEFVPRDEWARTIEIPPAEPPPDEPLRLHNVRSELVTAGDKTLLLVSGRIRNYSLERFSGVKVRLKVVQGEEVLFEELKTVGQSLDRKKLTAAKSLDDVKKAITSRLPDIGKEGVNYFAVVIPDLSADVLATAEYDYSVEIAD